MSINAFNPMGNTVSFLASNTPPTAVQAPSYGPGITAARFINSGSVLVFMGYGPSNAAAVANAVTVTNSQPSLPLLPGTDEILIFPPGTFFTGITAASNATVYITPGEGL